MTTMLYRPARRAAREVAPLYARKPTASRSATIEPRVGVSILRAASEAHAARMRRRNGAVARIQTKSDRLRAERREAAIQQGLYIQRFRNGNYYAVK